MDKDREFVSYFSCREGDDGTINVFHICNEHDAALEWCKSHSDNKKKSNKTTANDNPEDSKNEGAGTAPDESKATPTTDDKPDNTKSEPKEEDEFRSVLRRTLRSMKSFYDLIDINKFVRLFFPTLILGNDFDSFRHSLKMILDDGNYKIYGVSEDRISTLNHKIRRLEHTKEGIASIPANVLMGLVARYDANISGLVRFLLINKKEKITKSDRSISVKEIFAARSFDDLINDLVDDEIHSLMRGSHEEQVKYIEQTFAIEIQKDFERWGEYIEIFERRNLAAHGEGFANARYTKNCDRNNVPSGKRLPLGSRFVISDAYLRNATDLLLEFSILLIWWLWLKHSPKEAEEAYVEINDVTYELICEKRYLLSSRILESVMKRKTDKSPETVRRMMAVNLANCFKKLGQDAKCEEALKMFDWSAAADEYKISVASLRGEVEKVCSMMSRVEHADSVGKIGFREWPVFDWVRDNDLVKERFREVFGEPLEIAPEGEHEESSNGQRSDVIKDLDQIDDAADTA